MPKSSTSLHTWNTWLKSQSLGSLYQSSIWANFQEQIPGKGKTFFVSIESGEKILGGGFLIKHTLPFGLCWLACPRGPVFDSNLSKDELDDFFQKFLEKVRAIASQERAVFLRIDPPITDTSDQKQDYDEVIKTHHFREAHASYFPQTTLMIDLSQTEEEILHQMKPKGRYNIKVAQKHGVTVEKIPPTKDAIKKAFDDFYPLIEETSRRDKFAIHDRAYYETMLAALGESAELWIGYHTAAAVVPAPIPTPALIPLAGLIATYHTNTATYYYGASCHDHRHMMAPYLLQWEVMRDARTRGYNKYDLLGIAPTSEKNHPLAGVTDFKTKFGGTITTYAHAKELVFKPFWYWLMRLRKKLSY